MLISPNSVNVFEETFVKQLEELSQERSVVHEHGVFGRASLDAA
jgi:hypothetical protein